MLHVLFYIDVRCNTYILIRHQMPRLVKKIKINTTNIIKIKPTAYTKNVIKNKAEKILEANITKDVNIKIYIKKILYL